MPPVQSGTCTSFNTYGHPRPRRSLLQAEYIARRKGSNEQSIANKNGTQDARPRVQRDGEFLRDDRNRCIDQSVSQYTDTDPLANKLINISKIFLLPDLEWQGVAHFNHPGRPIGPRLPGRGEIPSTRITTISNETLQGSSAGSLSGMCS